MLLLENRAVCDVSAAMMPTNATLAMTDHAKSILGNGLNGWWENFRTTGGTRLKWIKGKRSPFLFTRPLLAERNTAALPAGTGVSPLTSGMSYIYILFFFHVTRSCRLSRDLLETENDSVSS